MSVVNTFTPATIISSSQVNANFTDIVDQLTNSLAADGQTTMLGAIKGDNGSAAAPSYSFASDLDTGVYRKAANQLGFATAGVERGYIDDSGNAALLGALNLGHASDTTLSRVSAGVMAVEGNVVDTFPTGTVMLFCQTSAPTGWTKDTTNNNNAALRIVTGAVGTGGTVDFTTAFVSQSVTGTTDGHALTGAENGPHQHFVAANATSQTALSDTTQVADNANFGNSNAYILTSTATAATLGLSSSSGSGTPHTHTFTGAAINLAVKRRDAIQATKA